MYKLVSKIAAAATLALAAIAPIALASAVHAEGREPTARIAYGDLNLRTPAGAGELEARIQAHGGALCSSIDRTVAGSRIPMSREACVARVRSEVMSQLPRTQQQAFAYGARANPSVVAGR
jgi:UrcA family protein